VIFFNERFVVIESTSLMLVPFFDDASINETLICSAKSFHFSKETFSVPLNQT
jgi:hypothetical protein